MDNLLSPETECYLLSIDERDFADVAAVLGLRARPASSNDQELVEAYLRDKDDFSQTFWIGSAGRAGCAGGFWSLTEV